MLPKNIALAVAIKVPVSPTHPVPGPRKPPPPLRPTPFISQAALPSVFCQTRSLCVAVEVADQLDTPTGTGSSRPPAIRRAIHQPDGATAIRVLPDDVALAVAVVTDMGDAPTVQVRSAGRRRSCLRHSSATALLPSVFCQMISVFPSPLISPLAGLQPVPGPVGPGSDHGFASMSQGSAVVLRHTCHLPSALKSPRRRVGGLRQIEACAAPDGHHCHTRIDAIGIAAPANENGSWSRCRC